MVKRTTSRRDFIRTGLLWTPAIVAPTIFIPKVARAQSVILRRRGGSAAAGGGSTLSSGLVFYAKAEESAGTNLLDAIASNDLTENGTGGVASATGKIGNCRDLEAADNDEFNKAEFAAIDFNGDVSFEGSLWCQLESKPSNVMTLVAKYDSSGQAQYFVGWWGSTTDRFSVLTSPDGTAEDKVDAATPAPPATATWYHVRWGRDATANLTFIAVSTEASYNSTETTVASTTIFNSTSQFRVGRCLTGLRWDGLIDDVCIWNRVLSASEKQENYNRTTAIL